MKKKNYARKGFTLVELLIVIVVIGILSAMMMLSSTEAMSSAKASNIASNLRNLKTATLAWYADHTDYVNDNLTIDFTGTHATTNSNIQSYLATTASNTDKDKVNVLKYFNNEGSIKFSGTPAADTYTLQGKDGSWYVGYQFPANSTSIIEKLIGRAKSIGLGLGTDTNPTTAIPSSASNVKMVWMKVLGSSN